MRSGRHHFIIVGAMVVSGCASPSTRSVDDVCATDRHARPAPRGQGCGGWHRHPEDIAHRTFVAVGDIAVRVAKTTVFDAEPTPPNEQLRQEGAGLGSDAVILVRYGKVGISALNWESLKATPIPLAD